MRYIFFIFYHTCKTCQRALLCGVFVSYICMPELESAGSYSNLLTLSCPDQLWDHRSPLPCSKPCSCRMRDSPPPFISTGLTLIGPSRPPPPISGPSALGPQGTGIAPRSSFTPLLDSSQGVGLVPGPVLWYEKRILRPVEWTKSWHLEWNDI